MQDFIDLIHRDLLPNLQVESIHPHNPVVVHQLPKQWQLIGTGNYAAVVSHPAYSHRVVKIYAPGRPGLQEEVEVYRHLGQHPAFSEGLYAESEFLILKRLYGITLYDCVHRGIKIPPEVIEDIDLALNYASSVGLYPHDVHGKNLMMSEGRGVVVDVSDFLKQDPCTAWNDLKRAYYALYRPILCRFPFGFPYQLLDLTRFTYRFYRRVWKQAQWQSISIDHKA